MDEVMKLGKKIGVSGFDVFFLVCVKVCGVVFIIDDLKMYEKVREIGIMS